jgi:hypothetical protein
VKYPYVLVLNLENYDMLVKVFWKKLMHF